MRNMSCGPIALPCAAPHNARSSLPELLPAPSRGETALRLAVDSNRRSRVQEPSQSRTHRARVPCKHPRTQWVRNFERNWVSSNERRGGETHTAANLFDALKEGTYGRYA